MVLIGLPEEQAEPDAWALSPGGLLRNKFRVQAGRRVLRLPVGFSCAAKAEIHSLTLFFFGGIWRRVFLEMQTAVHSASQWCRRKRKLTCTEQWDELGAFHKPSQDPYLNHAVFSAPFVQSWDSQH